MSISDERFYAQKDANFKQRVYNILFDDSAPHSEQEALALISNLSNRLEPIDINVEDKFISTKVIITDDNYADKVDTLVASMGTSDDSEETHDSEGC